MKCEKCGTLLDASSVCPNCSKFENVENTKVTEENGINKKKNIIDFFKEKKIIVILCSVVCLVIIILICLFLLNKDDRSKIITTIEESDNLKITIGDKSFYIGEKISDLKDKSLYYETFDDDNYVGSDSIVLENFYLDDDIKFLGVLYCGDSKNCSYDDSTLLKANFHTKSDVVVDDFIKIGSKYDDIVKKYGKEKGKFYQNSDFLVWSFGKKIGDPYYLLKFDGSSILNSSRVSEIRVGIWWYEGEYEHTVVKVKDSDK